MPHDKSEKALQTLEQKLKTLEAKRQPQTQFAAGRAFNDGYRLAASLIGGVLGGVGFGWLIDYFAHTSPLGVIGGLLIGTGVSVYSAVRASVRMSKQALKDHPPSPATFDEDDD